VVERVWSRNNAGVEAPNGMQDRFAHRWTLLMR
jgi:hypothetical protein